MSATAIAKAEGIVPRPRQQTAAAWRAAIDERFENLLSALEDERGRRQLIDNAVHTQLGAVANGLGVLERTTRALTNEVQAMKPLITDARRDVQEMKPLVSDYREKRAEGRGIGKILSWIIGCAAWFGTIAAAVYAARKG